MWMSSKISLPLTTAMLAISASVAYAATIGRGGIRLPVGDDCKPEEQNQCPIVDHPELKPHLVCTPFSKDRGYCALPFKSEIVADLKPGHHCMQLGALRPDVKGNAFSPGFWEVPREADDKTITTKFQYCCKESSEPGASELGNADRAKIPAHTVSCESVADADKEEYLKKTTNEKYKKDVYGYHEGPVPPMDKVGRRRSRF
ncbi:hypothetical protein P389DRAFT_182204 [Cystobasidium minutum MCA 4210]|uniref:uncharacterized protein n=1 Tax=Cystobasidium minutum MCA 4210 TaxID=1397322 RepID=UPI0034CF1EBB|eukprot:jgi/Rhomi1/182204/fgenesh1_pg.11_\